MNEPVPVYFTPAYVVILIFTLPVVGAYCALALISIAPYLSRRNILTTSAIVSAGLIGLIVLSSLQVLPGVLAILTMRQLCLSLSATLFATFFSMNLHLALNPEPWSPSWKSPWQWYEDYGAAILCGLAGAIYTPFHEGVAPMPFWSNVLLGFFCFSWIGLIITEFMGLDGRPSGVAPGSTMYDTFRRKWVSYDESDSMVNR